ncbi:nuclear transport factor 2 family protein [Blastococcus sp. TML/M2B]|uniref:nuclear transport factor 2 family protein n=1 Tax=unclassified Blastococcus TaxID=2619396 RepID=UPI00190954DA|nr:MULTISPECIES: nuclear transport factor 2 family protein [unclassified Blastococcus]MBN1091216.1 nuclear transport factor 2 family protein [Blastococcus sp. TML/M2B]MBN1095229.1 nuclear transport factor 2 family protein [Blastococcus sp. TML/C7B]
MTAEVAPDAVAAYGAAWVEPDATARLALLEQAWATDAVYSDPLAHVAGRAALADHIGQFQAAMPGGRIAVTSEPVRHHDSAFFRWSLTDADGAVVMTGFDVVQLDPAGRIARLTGFFDSDTGTAPAA